MKNISQEIREMLRAKRAALVGFADLEDIPEKQREGFRYGISIAVALDPVVIAEIDQGPTKAYYEEYNRLNDLLDGLSEDAVELLNANGHQALARTRAHVKIDEDIQTILPHKTVATKAGIGWIGKCALLVTPEFGSAVRVSTVLTDAKLEVGEPVTQSRCGGCTKCMEVCPAKAVLGVKWEPKLKREQYYNAYECQKTAKERSAKIGLEISLCGACIIACPWTKKYLKNR